MKTAHFQNYKSSLHTSIIFNSKGGEKMKKLISGFTLIELLIVIAVLGVLSSGVFVAIDPLDKLNAANDSKVQNDLGQIGQAMEAYAVSNTGVYPARLDILVTSGDLKTTPTAPKGYRTYTLGTGGTSQTACGQLKSKKYVNATPSTPTWVWCSSSGKAGPTKACTACP